MSNDYRHWHIYTYIQGGLGQWLWDMLIRHMIISVFYSVYGLLYFFLIIIKWYYLSSYPKIIRNRAMEFILLLMYIFAFLFINQKKKKSSYFKYGYYYYY